MSTRYLGTIINKVSSAVHLRFVVAASSLPDWLRERLLGMSDQRLSKDGVIVIKAQQYRTQEQNRADALLRLQALIDGASHTPKARRATQPTYGSKQRRLAGKSQRAAIKSLRGRVID
ncbi:alternative ribosome rescue aminoacyl-tRNA hydrolase ArfB [Chromobacterium amazonense]|uniref:Alternative ribosome rescue aminoacyl-tRNA hydrolase ArfB n=1 Tax=Chromobacterium amazonense TaxID=1382803 RepID=A0ABU8V4N0_9NEIS|nr:alternative ribosome rescue aminoacyl-tRNA hydrolase ArfB [Chromobacterium amazonense]MDQ4540328.1 alternative ribosome rescue aminoacyl-tRNA hydrolase ArfB [Chromobacterium amazonense]